MLDSTVITNDCLKGKTRRKFEKPGTKWEKIMEASSPMPSHRQCWPHRENAATQENTDRGAQVGKSCSITQSFASESKAAVQKFAKQIGEKPRLS